MTIHDVNMNIPNHFDIEEKLLSDQTSRCNKLLLKLYYFVVCFLKSFVLIAIALSIITILLKQTGVEIELGKLIQNVLDDCKGLSYDTNHSLEGDSEWS